MFIDRMKISSEELRRIKLICETTSVFNITNSKITSEYYYANQVVVEIFINENTFSSL